LTGDFVFPTFGPVSMREGHDEQVESRASELWTKAFDSLLELYDSYGDLLDQRLNSKLGSHHAKKGANVAMSDTAAAGFPQIFRTGWEVRTAHSVFDYIFGTLAMDTKAAKSSAKWFNNALGYIFGGYPPNPTDLLRQREKFHPFVQHLFASVAGYDPRVLDLLGMMLLVRFDLVVADIKKEPHGRFVNPMDHPFVNSVHLARSNSRVSHEIFDSWKKDANNAWLVRNKPGLSIDFSPEMRSVMVDERSLLSAFNGLVQSTGAIQGESSTVTALFEHYIMLVLGCEHYIMLQMRSVT